MTNILLAIIAVAELSRLLATYWPASKKSHFTNKLDGVGKMIWDLQFKLFKTREIREDIRKEYDFMKARIDGLNTQITNYPKDGNIDEKKRLDDQKVLAERDANRLEAQLRGLDVEMDGTKPSVDYPEGADGITQQIESLHELQSMLKNWIKKI